MVCDGHHTMDAGGVSSSFIHSSVSQSRDTNAMHIKYTELTTTTAKYTQTQSTERDITQIPLVPPPHTPVALTPA